MPSTVKILVESFRDALTPFVVGHPGGGSVEMLQAARPRDMRSILMRQGFADAMPASTWGEITGSPGDCLSKCGPGATNMVNGVAHASLDRCPLIAGNDRYPAPAYETGLRRRTNHQEVHAPATKWRTTSQAWTVRHQVRRAMRTIAGPPPGPEQFELPQIERIDPSRYVAQLNALREL